MAFCRGKVAPHGILLHPFQWVKHLPLYLFVRALRHHYPDLPITVTTMTPTGSERVRSAFGDDVYHVYLPYDLPGLVNRFLTTVDPKLVIIMETELWPNLISLALSSQNPIDYC